MGRVSRRDFLRFGGAAVTGAALAPHLQLARAAATGRTTLARTIVKGPVLNHGTAAAYYRLASGPGEPHILRQELAKRGAHPRRRSLLHFAHFTDIHLIDTQSPARVEFLDRYSDNQCSALPFQAAFRAHETTTLHVLEAMIRGLRAIKVSPITGAPLAFTMCTGDNIDNKQFNETRWFIDAMDGKTVRPNSGDLTMYEGVQAREWGDQEYWQPDPTTPDAADKYKRRFGFPDHPGLLDRAIQPFDAAGVGVPWYQVFGNHDGLLQGNAPKNPVFDQIVTGPLKVTGLPGIDPCDSFDIIQHNPAALLKAPAHVVGADNDRRIISHGGYIAEHFRSPKFPGPVGHGFTNENLANDTGYYVVDDADPRFRLIALDTLNPGGYEGGSIGQNQFDWLVEKLTDVSSRHLDENGNWVRTTNKDKLVILFSHHGLRSLDNPLVIPSTSLDDLDTSDLPRKMADEVQAAVQRFPNVIAWVNGHTHNNVITPRPGPIGGFWDIGTAAHVDWNSQSRLIEVIDNGDDTLSIVCTMFDHAGPLDPSGTTDPVLRLASIGRELSANDPQRGFDGPGPGHIEDRNAELVVKAPFKLSRGTAHASMIWTPRSGKQIAGAAAVAGTAAVIRRRQLLEKRLDG